MRRLLLIPLLLVTSLTLAAKPVKKAAPVKPAASAKDAGVATADAGLAHAGVADGGPVQQDAGTPQDAGVAIVPKPAVEKWDLVVDEVVFHSTTPMSTIDGTTQSMEAIAEGDFVTLRVPVDTIDTGIGLRNSHMRKYLESTTYPNAELKVRRELLKEGPKQEGTGTFTVHGVSREVKVNFEVSKAPGGLSVKGGFPVNLKQHAIAVPTYLGITVRPDLKVTASFLIKR